jgi:hypothetical protein
VLTLEQAIFLIISIKIAQYYWLGFQVIAFECVQPVLGMTFVVPPARCLYSLHTSTVLLLFKFDFVGKKSAYVCSTNFFLSRAKLDSYYENNKNTVLRELVKL